MGRIQTFCAFCKVPRKIYLKKNVGWFEIFISLIASIAIMEIKFNGFDLRGVAILAFFLFIAESFLQARWRMTIRCTHCGFDPVVYKKNPNIAAQNVKLHLEATQDKPGRYLGPAMHIPTRTKEKSLSQSKTVAVSSKLNSKSTLMDESSHLSEPVN